MTTPITAYEDERMNTDPRLIAAYWKWKHARDRLYDHVTFCNACWIAPMVSNTDYCPQGALLEHAERTAAFAQSHMYGIVCDELRAIDFPE